MKNAIDFTFQVLYLKKQFNINIFHCANDESFMNNTETPHPHFLTEKTQFHGIHPFIIPSRQICWIDYRHQTTNPLNLMLEVGLIFL